MIRPTDRPENTDSLLDRAVGAVLSDSPEPDAADRAASRVWSRLAADGAPADPPDPIRGCAGFEVLIPAFVAGELAESRALLVEDHTRSCVGCRRALATARTESAAARSEKVAARTQGVAAGTETHARPLWVPTRRSTRWLGRAAVLLLAAGTLALLWMSGFGPGGGKVMAELTGVYGNVVNLHKVAHDVDAGAEVREGQRLRTAEGSRAVVRLADGSLIEMGERAELSLDRGLRGTTIRLGHGKIIVQAAPQGRGRLYVATEDCQVAVKGTIFSVNHGIKGSRVSVIEGKVEVSQRNATTVLLPGEQVTTDPSLDRVPVEAEIAWSQDTEHYTDLLRELMALSREIHERVELPGLRYAGPLLELAPGDTVAYFALPNLSGTLSESYDVLQERLAGSTVLSQWWQEMVVDTGHAPEIEQLVQRVTDFGGYLGEEIVVALARPVRPENTVGDEEMAPIFLAEVTGSTSFAEVLAQEVERINDENDGGQDVLVLVEDPSSAAAGDERLLIWTDGDHLVATPDAALLARVAAVVAGAVGPEFPGTPFHGRLVTAYDDGVEWLFGADLEQLVAAEIDADDEADPERAQFEASGFADARFLIAERFEDGDRAQTSAELSFSQPRRGVASWLAAPAAMGALEFVSGEATFVASALVKAPSLALEDLIAIAGVEGDGNAREAFDRARQELGVDFENEIVGALGGEVAFAVDGPLLPTPSWKAIVEVVDPAGLQGALETLVERARQESASGGEEGPVLSSEEVGGETFHTLSGHGTGPDIHYLYTDGYLLAAASRALVRQALQVRDAGNDLVSSPRFRELLPQSGEVHFSALVYRDLTGLTEILAAGSAGAASLSAGPLTTLMELASEFPTSLTYAYGEEDRILIANSGPPGLPGVAMGPFLGMGGVLESLFEGAPGAE